MKILIKKVSELDLKFTFTLRNNKFIRKNFFDEKTITYTKHQDWFSKKFKNKKNLYFIISNKTKKIGLIRYDKTNFYYNISISILPKYQSANIGSEAILISEKFIKKGMLIANIKDNNKKSLNFFKKNGYTVLTKDKDYTLYKIINTNENEKNNILIGKIQNIRSNNNVNWMDILRIAFESSPDKTKKVFKNIFTDDKNINAISKKLFS